MLPDYFSTSKGVEKRFGFMYLTTVTTLDKVAIAGGALFYFKHENSKEHFYDTVLVQLFTLLNFQL